jgi:hypothetical protein
MWIIAVAAFIAYVITISTTLILSQNNPTTTLVLEPPRENIRTFPAVTICNWNTGGLPPNHGNNCSFCQLQLTACYFADYTCTAEITDRIAPTIISSEGAIFYCYQFNTNASDVWKAEATGYDGAVSLVFDISLAPSFETSTRLGLQVTFHSQSTEPAVWDETNYIRAWTDGSYGIQEVRTVPLYGAEEISYEVVPSSIGLAGLDVSTVPPGQARVIVSFSYSSLDQKVIQYLYTYNISSYLGDLAGMVGLLIGLDMLKMFRGVLALTKCRQKGIKPFIRTFNA